ncbi:Phosphoserine aminotransferase [Hartmannibacter diazotrophicus]|uniref:phosphoserine transaminase n=1 Tax=Hartmannibacter diazotrophicus TaxID=1482074 RepID=A0A2C9DC14_9HYPH|nr:phosphoserine transaminase [Hartmannibacter diazotrophicus]SON57135.1 Phosphoserine aminotransferase [Hartmannibacter diazotrophicus]
MMMTAKPAAKPANPRFSSGPCSKRPGWSLEALTDAALGRSHRAKIGKTKLQEAIDLTRDVLRVPDDYRIGIVPASDTGAVEMAMWSMLGPRPVDVAAWEAFGSVWVSDAVKQLKVPNTRTFTAPYGVLPAFDEIDFDHDVVFTWNGTAAGVRVPRTDFIPADRKGLTICDATSAAFAMELPFDKLDVVTFSWQKVMGGEAAHGMLILSPRAVERLETYVPDRPLPKIFQLTKGGKLNEGIFKGDTINTPSMLCVEDYLDAMNWAKSIGGLDTLIARSEASAKALFDWVERTPFIDFLCAVPEHRSTTGVCLKFVDPRVANLDEAGQQAFVKTFTGLLEKDGVAFDIASYRDAPPGLRIWCGSTVETADIEALLPWLDWAFEASVADIAKAA